MSSGSLVTNKELARSIGLHPAIMFCELLSKEDYFEERGELKEGWFFNTIENMEKDTFLSEYQQRETINILQKLGLIDYKLKGMPAMRYFKINGDKLYELLELGNSEKLTNSQRETNKLTPRNSRTYPKKLKGNNTNLNNTKSKQLAEFESLKKELEDINFSKPEIDVLLEMNTPEQIKEKLKVLENRKDIRIPKAYFIKILKADYPSKDTPVISDNGNNGNHSNDYIYQKWVVKKDPLTPEERKKNNERIIELAGEVRKKLGLVKGRRELINN